MNTHRRRFAATVAALATTAFATRSAQVAAHEGHEHHDEALGLGDRDGYVMGAGLEHHCATCTYWGGPRRVATDRASITVMGLGWCNNPQSPNFQKQTSPEHGPMETWQKWAALP